MREFDQGLFKITIAQRTNAERHRGRRKSRSDAGKCPDGSLDTAGCENKICHPVMARFSSRIVVIKNPDKTENRSTPK